ncbi:LysM peptidoglycan-binding domain-containing protein [Bacillus sp. X1(2014)]|uniref:LysM peptidoglycan-binding domain-containing protein n=1 Tax=Bacillus sp. X1(2014) TaxID=1565991 RepID=UPI0011A3E97D|nr:LysM peptidoglycan-binding domain-containing protein [Bacillus sp. X1(2014)]
MNSEEPYRDQAERLKQRIEKINEKMDLKDDLPPRERIHRQKKRRTKWKLKYPVIRLLVLFFILLPIIIFSVISYRDGATKVNGVPKNTEDSVGYETINLETSDDEEEPKVEDLDQSKETNPVDNTTVQPSNEVKQAETTEPIKKTAEVSTEPQKNSTVTHKVKPNENLYRIALKYYHSPKGMDIIMKANNLKSKQVNAGQILKIPLNN